MKAAALLLLWPIATLSAQPPQVPEHLCIAANVYFEARAEPLKGMIAVKDVTRNRGGNACVTVFAKSQFSWTAQFPWKRIEQFLTDSPKNLHEKEVKAWELCKQIAQSTKSVLSKDYKYFHATYVSPTWTRAGLVIGNHKFIREIPKKGK